VARRPTYGPQHAISGYPKAGKIMSWDGKEAVGKIVSAKCKKVRPHERGSWISGERCSYVVDVNGRRYAGRGRGDGIHVNLRQMKRR
jgi:hypothetical protein